MNKEERVKLVFETISKIVGFEIKPNNDFYMIVNGEKNIYKIDENLSLHYRTPNGYIGLSVYNILPIFKGGYQLEEIKEPLLTEEEKDFLRNFKFAELFISRNLLYMYGEDKVYAINLNDINLSFDGLKKYKTYSGKELGL